jgi:hypothetical protein
MYDGVEGGFSGFVAVVVTTVRSAQSNNGTTDSLIRLIGRERSYDPMTYDPMIDYQYGLCKMYRLTSWTAFRDFDFCHLDCNCWIFAMVYCNCWIFAIVYCNCWVFAICIAIVEPGAIAIAIVGPGAISNYCN